MIVTLVLYKNAKSRIIFFSLNQIDAKLNDKRNRNKRFKLRKVFILCKFYDLGAGIIDAKQVAR